MTAEVTLLLIAAYIVGSIPFGVLIARAHAGVDITKLGSGNIGATNVQRVLGWRAAVPVLILDIAKGLVPALIARGMHLSWPPTLSVVDIAFLAGIAAVLGHCASPFLKFKGGKGIATICGTALGATPDVALIGISAFVLTTLLTGYISLSSIVAILAATLAAYLLRYDGLVIGAYAAICLFIMYKHRSNIGRLMKGEEPKFNFKNGRKPENRESEDDAPSQLRETESEEDAMKMERSATD